MTNVEETKTEVSELLKAKFPKSPVSRVDVEESSDADGQPSINIWIVFHSRPAKEEMRYARSSLIDELRTWLSQKGDDRFPYLSFVTEQDEKELSQQ